MDSTDVLSSILSSLSDAGIPTMAKLNFADHRYSYEEPKELIRRRENQLELLAHVEGNAFKLGPAGQDMLKNIMSKPKPGYGDEQNAKVGGAWVHKDLAILLSKISKVKPDVKLKDVPAISELCDVKDETISVGQFKLVLNDCNKDFKERPKELQKILRISDDDLSAKNLRRFLKNIDTEADKTAHVYRLNDNNINVDLDNLPKITHKDLDFNDADDLPETIADMVREIGALSSGGQADDEDEENIAFRRRNAPNNAREALGIFVIFQKLFPSVKYDVLLDEGNPQSTAVEVERVKEAFIDAMDKITHHAWESKICLILIRSMRQVVLLSVHGDEQDLVKDSMKRFMDWKAKLIDARI